MEDQVKIGNCDILDLDEILTIVRKSTTSPEELEDIDKNKLKVIAIEFVQAFVQANWLCGRCQYFFITDELIQLLNTTFTDPISFLSPDDKYIPAFKKLQNPSLICYASSLLKHFNPEESLEDCLWVIRILIIKQMVINKPCDDILCVLKKNIGFLETHLEALDDRKSVILGYMLACQVYLWYRLVQNAMGFLQKAINLSDLNIELEGRMGKRTKYQRESKSLLNVMITRKGAAAASAKQLNEQQSSGNVSPDLLVGAVGGGSHDLPISVNLMDDTLLTKVEFDDEDGSEQSFTIILREEEEAIVCGLVSYLMISCESGDNLVKEEISAYLDYLIDHCKVWSVVYKCLYLRSLLEREKNRKIERSMAQLEELVKSVKNEPCSGCSWKLHLFYPVLMDPIWKTEKALADMFAAIGALKSALDIYLELGLWEEIVNCYLRLDRREKAELFVREQLNNGETPYLLCVLGDVAQDKDQYEKAWELSKGKCARAQKSLGDWYYFHKDYSQCISYYQTALEINSTMYTSWMRLAFAALMTKDYPECARAYRRAVNFEPDNFEAWNNLSTAYIKMGDKHRAFRTLQESIKCNYDEWKVWENLLHVSIDIGAFDAVIQAWHRLIVIKGKHEDDKLVEILVNAVLADIEDTEGEKSSRLVDKTLKLLSRIVENSPGTFKLWKAYGKLSIANNEGIRKIIECLTKSHQSCMNQVNWEKNAFKTLDFLKNCNDLYQYYLIVYERCEDVNYKCQFLFSFSLSLKSFLIVVKRNENYWEKSEYKDEIKRFLDQLDERSNHICSILDNKTSN